MNAVAAIERADPPAALIADRIPGAEFLPAAKNRAEWLLQRRQGVGGSDAAPAAGLSPWKSPFELYLDKLGELPDQVDTPALYWGRKLEPVVLQAYAETLQGDFVFSGLPTMRSTRYPWMITNLDAMTASAKVIEAKCARSRDGFGEPGSGEVPMHYLLQCQHEMIVTGLHAAVLVVLFHGNDLQVFDIPEDPELQGMLIESSQEFWSRVQRRDPPTDRTISDTILRYGSVGISGKIVAAEADLRHVQTLRDAREAIEALGKTADESKQWIMETLGDKGDTLVDAQGKALVTWKLPAAPQRFDVEAFAARHPDLYAQYLRSGKASRRFLVKD